MALRNAIGRVKSGENPVGLSIARYQLGAATIERGHFGRDGGEPSQRTLKFVFVPYIILIAERKVVGVNCWIGRQREKIRADAFAGTVPDRGFLHAARGEAPENFFRLIGRAVIGYE